MLKPSMLLKILQTIPFYPITERFDKKIELYVKRTKLVKFGAPFDE